MPIHDWSKVEAGIFHAFHHAWIDEISRALNRKRLPSDYYALPKQVSGGYGPDVLTLNRPSIDTAKKKCRPRSESNGTAILRYSRGPCC